MKMVLLTREQLHKWVWSEPVSKIAVELGISDVAIKKKCNAAGVPTPGRGYWRQVDRGMPVQRTDLPQSGRFAAFTTLKVSVERADRIEKLPAIESSFQNDPSSHSSSTRGQFPPSADTVPGQSPVQSPLAHVELNKVMVSPDQSVSPADVIHSLQKLAVADMAHKFLSKLSAAGQVQDAGTQGVLAHWLELAKEELRRTDPVQSVLDECRRIARKEIEPEWWRSVQLKRYRD